MSNKLLTEHQKEICDFLVDLMEKSFNQGDIYFAHMNKKRTSYIFGYSNDYPLQHGDGEENKISEWVAEYLYKNRKEYCNE